MGYGHPHEVFHGLYGVFEAVALGAAPLGKGRVYLVMPLCVVYLGHGIPGNGYEVGVALLKIHRQQHQHVAAEVVFAVPVHHAVAVVPLRALIPAYQQYVYPAAHEIRIGLPQKLLLGAEGRGRQGLPRLQRRGRGGRLGKGAHGVPGNAAVKPEPQGHAAAQQQQRPAQQSVFQPFFHIMKPPPLKKRPYLYSFP